MPAFSNEDQQVINELHKHWIWIPNWRDSADDGSAARLVTFTKRFSLSNVPQNAIIHCTADTRYKLVLNGSRVTIGPTRSSPDIWYYDTLDLGPFLVDGENTIEFLVIRYFLTVRAGLPFVRTPFPGLTMTGRVGEMDMSTDESWEAQIQPHVAYPTGLIDDVFLHINERVTPQLSPPSIVTQLYSIKTVNGEQPPWRLRPRGIPLPEQTPVSIETVNNVESSCGKSDWLDVLSGRGPLSLTSGHHKLDIQAACHSTAFLRWTFRSRSTTKIRFRFIYSEGYELEPRSYPWLRTKGDRLDSSAMLLGPADVIELDLPADEEITYEPFWFRTFRLLRVEADIETDIELVSFAATQVNYPMDVKARFQDSDPGSKDILDLCVRTMRNCMLDGYSDCPFYEQLQYAGDTRSVGLFHYLLSGDDRLTRQAITHFASSITIEGLTQSRYPSAVPQIIFGFPLYWVLMIVDHMLFFGDQQFARSFLPRIDGVLEVYASRIDELGLISGVSPDVWQYVDWVDTWGATDQHPDKGVPTSGRKSNRHTYFSLLYIYTLRQTIHLLRQLGRTGYVDEYEARAVAVASAVKQHCYDGRYFTDSTADIGQGDPLAYSQHCQVFAVLAGVVDPDDTARLLTDSFAEGSNFSKCSYVMLSYVFRAYAQAGIYDREYRRMLQPWRKMLTNNLSTLEEDDVRQRSDCHAWGAAPVFEFLSEVAGVWPIEAGCTKIRWAPRLSLSQKLDCTVSLGKENTATVRWGDGDGKVVLTLSRAIKVVSIVGGEELDHGEVDQVVSEMK